MSPELLPRLTSMLVAAAFVTLPQPSMASEKTERNIAYRENSGADPAIDQFCRLHISVPEGERDFATIVWFHGGGLTAGEPTLPGALRNKGVAVASAGYRLSPGVSSPVYVEDAAAAIAWVFQNIEKYGGSPDKIFVGGASAGGYLALMNGLDKKYLATHGIDANRIAGLIPLSAQAITHFTVRKERGVDGTRPVVDEMAPLYHIRADAPPILLITGDRELELLGRYEENAYLERMLKVKGHKHVELREIPGRDHGGVEAPGLEMIPPFVNQVTASEKPE